MQIERIKKWKILTKIYVVNFMTLIYETYPEFLSK